jgi:hypothetical protein
MTSSAFALAQRWRTEAAAVQGCARPGLTDIGHFFECRHLDFGVSASHADRCVILVAPDFKPIGVSF